MTIISHHYFPDSKLVTTEEHDTISHTLCNTSAVFSTSSDIQLYNNGSATIVFGRQHQYAIYLNHTAVCTAIQIWIGIFSRLLDQKLFIGEMRFQMTLTFWHHQISRIKGGFRGGARGAEAPPLQVYSTPVQSFARHWQSCSSVS